jgi:hypothetical protein
VGGRRPRQFDGTNFKTKELLEKRADSHQSAVRCVGRFYVVQDYPPKKNITAILTEFYTQLRVVPTFSVMINAPPNDGYCRIRNPLVPTELDTFRIKVSTLDG